MFSVSLNKTFPSFPFKDLLWVLYTNPFRSSSNSSVLDFDLLSTHYISGMVHIKGILLLIGNTVVDIDEAGFPSRKMYIYIYIDR